QALADAPRRILSACGGVGGGEPVELAAPHGDDAEAGALAPRLAGARDRRRVHGTAYAAPARIAGVAEGRFSEQPGADRRAEPVGTHQEVGFFGTPVAEAQADPFAFVLVTDHLAVRADAVGAAGIEQDPVEAGAVDADHGRAQLATEPAQVDRLEEPAGAVEDHR